jgi:hypothetical protein
VEIYKGLPLPTLVFYSIFYFSIFVTAFVFFGGYYFVCGPTLLRPLTALTGVCGVFIGVALFDSQALRNFFALSSVLTATNVFLTLVA